MNTVLRRTLALTFATSILAACAVDNQNTGFRGAGFTYKSDVKTLSDGTFYVEAEAAPLAGRESGAKIVAEKQAMQHCQARNQKMTILKNDMESHLLVNGVSRLTFKCE